MINVQVDQFVEKLKWLLKEAYGNECLPSTKLFCSLKELKREEKWSKTDANFEIIVDWYELEKVRMH